MNIQCSYISLLVIVCYACAIILSIYTYHYLPPAQPCSSLLACRILHVIWMSLPCCVNYHCIKSSSLTNVKYCDIVTLSWPELQFLFIMIWSTIIKFHCAFCVHHFYSQNIVNFIVPFVVSWSLSHPTTPNIPSNTWDEMMNERVEFLYYTLSEPSNDPNPVVI
jgi:hypothetical protein